MSHELTLTLDTAPDAITPTGRDQILNAAKAVAVSLGIVGITDKFAIRRDELVATAWGVPQVQDPSELEIALAAYRNLRDFEKEVEREEGALKGPLNDAKNRLLRLIETEMATAGKAKKRLKDMIDGYEAEQEAKRQAAARAAEQERARIAAEAAKAQRMAEEAERQRRAAQDAAARAEHSKGAESEKAKAEAARAAAEATRLEEEAFNRSLQAEMAPEPTLAEPEKTQGVSAREVLDYEVIGANQFQQHDSLIAFAKSNPRLVKVEIKRRDLLDALASGQITEAPGIRIVKKLDTRIR